MKKRILLYIIGAALLAVAWIFSGNPTSPNDFSSKSKIALREVGDRMLRADGDSTSLVLPIKEVADNLFQLSFEKELSMDPGLLVSTFENSLHNAGLTDEYIVEVIRTSDKEVAYSYQMNTGVEETIVACGGRVLPEDEYRIEARLLRPAERSLELHWGYLLVILGLIVLLDFFFFRKNKNRHESSDPPHLSVGSFRFFPDQNKLVKKSEEISLSRKECELLAIFVERPNEVIKREELTKKVWEDNGVIVGRSLDTYISKLRKKLQQDETIKLTNVHGVGYKLELA
ncbi:winged helix-turn-helix transcriptional regulator [Aureitalea sp. L0-47]|uniref:winged helix-turn-helix domain-containing protein n=1 Tax=Aureitalea sp. L0-47 TaxID=2816962 RepID=UPI002237BC34|nr:winged helix-turn-helix domain-containing protein [Aureitalea sp. L0-47]MCW5519426.1 winged helix-turn-helix transcriptional regulator [Aureitalea sp. L0-47]